MSSTFHRDLKQLLSAFTAEALKVQPEDIKKFAAQYFTKLYVKADKETTNKEKDLIPHVASNSSDDHLDGRNSNASDSDELELPPAAPSPLPHSVPTPPLPSVAKCSSCGSQLPSGLSTNKYQCPTCGKWYQACDKKTSVSPSKPDKRTWVCGTCSMVLPSCEDLRRHRKEHKQQWVCHACGKVYTHRGNYNVHLRNHDQVSENCQHCGKELTTWRQKKRHEIIHKGKEKSVCNVCGKVFLLRQQLQLHMERHNEYKKYQCPTCGKWFQARPDFNQHKARHKHSSQDAVYTCHACPHTTCRLKLLNEHIMAAHPPPVLPPAGTLQIQSAIDSIQPLTHDFSYQ